MELSPPVRQFVESVRVARLATLDARGAPHVVPVCFVLLDGRVYSVVDEKPKRTTRLQRLLNVAADPRATLLVDRYDEDWTRLAWVMLRGHAEVIESSEADADVLTALREKYPQYRAMALEGLPVVCLTPERVNAWGLV